MKLQMIKKYLIDNKQTSVVIITGLIVILIYIIGKRDDQKIILYQNAQENAANQEKIIANDSNIYQKKEKLINSKIEVLEKRLQELTNEIEKNKEMDSEVEVDHLEYDKEEEQEEKQEEPYQEPPPTPVKEYRPANVSAQVIAQPSPDIISFPVQLKDKSIISETEQNFSVTIPSGSFVKAKLLTGVEAPEAKALPVLLQADYAFIGPNKTKIDLSGCFIIAKSVGNLSTERVEMQTTKISCVGRTGRTFERSINGFVADDKDNSFAVIGDVNSKQDRVASMAFLSSIVEGIGSAIGKAQMSITTNANGAQTEMVTGSESKFIAANGASNAASTITQWYLKHAQGLFPTINIGSGADVWIIVQDSVQLPNWYFNLIKPTNQGMSFLTKLNE